jgi:glycosyltransferase involved in cell wall biosynthesis
MKAMSEQAFQEIRFVIPDPSSFKSGGNHYNSGLISGLREIGLRCTITTHDNLQVGNSSNPICVDSLYLLHASLPDLLDNHPGPKILLAHHMDCLYPENEERFQNVFLPHLKLFDRIVCTGDFLWAYLVTRGFSPSTLIVLEPVPVIAVTRKDRNAGKIHALIAANLIDRKGLLPFLESLAQQYDGTAFKLRIAGSAAFEPDYAEGCFACIANHRFLQNSVSYTGEQDVRGMESLYASSDCLISTSKMETFGMSMQEAVVAGLPILALERGNAGRHVNHGENGLLCPDVPSLTRHFLDWAHNPDTLSAFITRANSVSWTYQAMCLINFLSE